MLCKKTQDLASGIHNLVRLSEIAKLKLDMEQLDIVSEFNAFNIEGRYPDPSLPSISRDEAQDFIERANEVFQWLKNQL